MLLDTDLPYLEPLLFWLQDDESLKQHFTRDSFFMPHDSFLSAIDEAMQKNCPAPRALWILPQDSFPTSKNVGCKSNALHRFSIMIMVQCIRDSFQISNVAGKPKLTGQFMELTQLRKIVKNSVHRFSLHHEKTVIVNKKFSEISWNADKMLYPQEHKFLATNIEFEVKIYP